LPHHFLAWSFGRNDDAVFEYRDFYGISTFLTRFIYSSHLISKMEVISENILILEII